MAIKKSVIQRVRQWVSKYDDEGREIMDPTPVAVPVGFKPPETIEEKVLRLVRSAQIQQQLDARGAETFEEAEDFDVGDDVDPTTPYEMEFDPGLGRDITRAEKQFIDAQRAQFDHAHKVMKQERPKQRPPSKKAGEKPDAAKQQKPDPEESDSTHT